MIKNRKKIIISIVVLALIICSYFGIKYFNNINKKVVVTPVYRHNWGSMGMDGIGGMVFESNTQAIYLDGVKKIEEVYVKEGDRVSAGDKLIAFDTETLRISTEIKKIEIEKLDIKLAKLKHELKKISESKIKEASKNQEPTPPPLPKKECNVDEKGVYSCLNADYFTKDWKVNDKNSIEKPLEIKINEEGKIYAAFVNVLKDKVGKNKDYYVSISINEQPIWKFNVNDIGSFNDESFWFVKEKDDKKPDDQEEDDLKIPEGITKKERAKLLREKEKEINDLILEQRRADLSLKELEEQLGDGIVYAKNDGVIKNLQDIDGTLNSSSPFLEVVGGTGVTIRGEIDEFMLQELKINQKVFVLSHENGNSYEAKIVEIDEFPVKNQYSYKPNVSYYNFIAYIDTEDKLSNGSYLEIKLSNPEEDFDAVLLENAYIREEKGKKYVMKEVDGVLVKQYIKTGKVYFGESTEILEGITNEDYIAFPYGDGEIEGVKTIKEDLEMDGAY